MADQEWREPPNMDDYLKYQNRRDNEPIDEAADLLKRANMADHPVSQYSDHFWDQQRLNEVQQGGMDRPGVARETGERMAQLREEGFQGTDNEALFVARRDVVREENLKLDAQIGHEEQQTQEQILEYQQLNPPRYKDEVIELANRLAKSRKRGRSM